MLKGWFLPSNYFNFKDGVGGSSLIHFCYVHGGGDLVYFNYLDGGGSSYLIHFNSMNGGVGFYQFTIFPSKHLKFTSD